MHYFSLHTEDDEHVGFLIMYPHENSHHQSGDLAVKLREDLPEMLRRHVQVLAEWEKQPALRGRWKATKWTCGTATATYAAVSVPNTSPSATIPLF